MFGHQVHTLTYNLYWESTERCNMQSCDVCLSSEASWSKGDLGDWERHFSILTLLTLYPPVHPSSELYYVGFRWATCRLWSLSPSPTLFVIQRLVGLYPVIAVGCWRLRGWSMLVSGTLFYSFNIWIHQRSERIFYIPFPFQNWSMVQAVEIEWICLFS